MNSEQLAEMQAAIEKAVFDIERLECQVQMISSEIHQQSLKSRIFMPLMLIIYSGLLLANLYGVHEIMQMLSSIHRMH